MLRKIFAPTKGRILLLLLWVGLASLSEIHVSAGPLCYLSSYGELSPLCGALLFPWVAASKIIKEPAFGFAAYLLFYYTVSSLFVALWETSVRLDESKRKKTRAKILIGIFAFLLVLLMYDLRFRGDYIKNKVASGFPEEGWLTEPQTDCNTPPQH